MHEHKNLLLTIASAVTSISSFIISHVTKADIAFAIGCSAGLMSLYSGYLTSKEKKISIKKMQGQQKDELEAYYHERTKQERKKHNLN
jgi:hypothetical protein